MVSTKKSPTEPIDVSRKWLIKYFFFTSGKFDPPQNTVSVLITCLFLV